MLKHTSLARWVSLTLFALFALCVTGARAGAAPVTLTTPTLAATGVAYLAAFSQGEANLSGGTTTVPTAVVLATFTDTAESPAPVLSVNSFGGGTATDPGTFALVAGSDGNYSITFTGTQTYDEYTSSASPQPAGSVPPYTLTLTVTDPGANSANNTTSATLTTPVTVANEVLSGQPTITIPTAITIPPTSQTFQLPANSVVLVTSDPLDVAGQFSGTITWDNTIPGNTSSVASFTEVGTTTNTAESFTATLPADPYLTSVGTKTGSITTMDLDDPGAGSATTEFTYTVNAVPSISLTTNFTSLDIADDDEVVVGQNPTELIANIDPAFGGVPSGTIDFYVVPNGTTFNEANPGTPTGTAAIAALPGQTDGSGNQLYQAIYSWTPLPVVGTYTIYAQYVPDSSSSYLALLTTGGGQGTVDGTGFPLSVVASPTSTTMDNEPASGNVNPNQAITLNAYVEDDITNRSGTTITRPSAIITGAPEGSVYFYDYGPFSPWSGDTTPTLINTGGTTLTPINNSNGAGTVQQSEAIYPWTAPTTIGVHNIAAFYVPVTSPANWKSSNSIRECVSYVVVSQAPGTSTVSLGTIPTTVDSGTSFPLTANVTGTSSVSPVAPPSGAVAFYAIPTATTLTTNPNFPIFLGCEDVVNGVAGLPAAAANALTTPGTYTIEAVYAGDGNYAGSTVSSAAGALTVVAGGDSMTLTSVSDNDGSEQPQPINAVGNTFTLTATITATDLGVEPEGTVTFYLGSAATGTVLGVSDVGDGGVASIETEIAAVPGTYTITAVFDGGSSDPYDTQLAPATATTTQTLVAALMTSITLTNIEFNPNDENASEFDCIDVQEGAPFVSVILTGTGFTTSTTVAIFSNGVSTTLPASDVTFIDGDHLLVTIPAGAGFFDTYDASNNPYGDSNEDILLFSVTNPGSPAETAPTIINDSEAYLYVEPGCLTGFPATTITATVGTTLSDVLVGTFTDTDTSSRAGSFFSAELNWEDGSPVSAGTVVPTSTPGLYDVYGSHTYLSTTDLPAYVGVNVIANNNPFGGTGDFCTPIVFTAQAIAPALDPVQAFIAPTGTTGDETGGQAATGLIPDSGLPGTYVILTGENFVNGATVTWVTPDGTILSVPSTFIGDVTLSVPQTGTTEVSADDSSTGPQEMELECTVPVGASGVCSVSVVNPDGLSSGTDLFTVTTEQGPLTQAMPGWNLVGYPYVTPYSASDLDASSVWGTQQIFDYNPGTGAYEQYPSLGVNPDDYTFGPDNQVATTFMYPGIGYWVHNSAANAYDVTVAGSDVPLTLTVSSIDVTSASDNGGTLGTTNATVNGAPNAWTSTLLPGWNLVSDPFTVPVSVTGVQFILSAPQAGIDLLNSGLVSLGQAQAAGNVLSGFFGYDNSTNAYFLSGTLQPYQGYWIHVSGQSAITIVYTDPLITNQQGLLL